MRRSSRSSRRQATTDWVHTHDEAPTVTRKPFLVVLLPGPIYDLKDRFAEPLELLSRSFDGIVLTSSSSTRTEQFGSFVVRTTALEDAGISRHFRFLAHVFRSVRECLRSGRRPSVVTTYDPLITGIVGWLVARWTGAVLIPEVNGDYTAWENHLSPTGRRRHVRRAVLLAIEGFVLRRADAVKLQFDQQIAYFGDHTPKRRMHLFNYVNLRGFHDARAESPPYVILFVGYPLEVKGLDVLIEAFKRVHGAAPEWRLKIIGWYPDRSALDAHVDGHAAIDVSDPVRHDLIATEMANCRIFVLPSRTEGIARVLMESAAVGVARVATRVGGTATVVADGIDGLLVEPGNVESLAAALLRLMTDGGLRDRLGAAAALRARTEFTAAAYAEKIADFYQDLLDARAANTTVTGK